MGTTKQPWTAKHVNEAKAALYRLGADYAAKGQHADAFSCVHVIGEQEATATYRGFVTALGFVRRIYATRILRTVCARAEGREVVENETFFRVRFADGRYVPENVDDDSSDAVAADAKRCVDRMHATEVAYRAGAPVRVTLTRRRILKAKKGGG